MPVAVAVGSDSGNSPVLDGNSMYSCRQKDSVKDGNVHVGGIAADAPELLFLLAIHQDSGHNSPCL